MTVRLDNFFKVVISKHFNLTFIIHENNDSFYYKKNSLNSNLPLLNHIIQPKTDKLKKVLIFFGITNFVYIFGGIFDSVTNL